MGQSLSVKGCQHTYTGRGVVEYQLLQQAGLFTGTEVTAPALDSRPGKEGTMKRHQKSLLSCDFNVGAVRGGAAFASTISNVWTGSSSFFSAKRIHFIAILLLRILLRVYKLSRARRSWPFKVGLDLNDCSFALTRIESTLLAAEKSLSKALQHSDVRDRGEGKNSKVFATNLDTATNCSRAWVLSHRSRS